MFCRCNVADQISTKSGRVGGPDGGADMIVARPCITGDGAKHVIGRLAGHSFLEDDIALDLIQRYVAGAFHHHLATQFSSSFRQLAIYDHFGYLGSVTAVMYGTGANPIPQGQHRIIFFHQGADPVELLIERILFFVHVHPGNHEGAAF